jgi:transcriptional regulator with XRE-family HTH domain
MNIKLSQKQIGQRITELRKMKGLSQEDLAKSVKISRPSLAQIELGNRSVDILELQKLSLILQFSLDDFMSKDFSASQDIDGIDEKKAKKEEERISVPTLHISKFKNVLLYILERCAGKPNVGETVLYKLLYFSDFNYYELYEEHLTGAKYRKLPYGPVPQKLDTIIGQMIEKGQLQRVKTEYRGYPQTRYLVIECRGNWYGEAGVKPVTLVAYIYEGGTISQTGFKFTNVGYTKGRFIEGVKVNVDSYSQDPSVLGDLMGYLVIDTTDNTAQFRNDLTGIV